MRCPNCLSELELCENIKICKKAPHWICSNFFGCGFSMPATAQEIQELKWEGVINVRPNK